MKYNKKNLGSLRTRLAWGKMHLFDEKGVNLPFELMNEEFQLIGARYPRLEAQFEGDADPSWVAKWLPNYKPDDYLPPTSF